MRFHPHVVREAHSDVRWKRQACSPWPRDLSRPPEDAPETKATAGEGPSDTITSHAFPSPMWCGKRIATSGAAKQDDEKWLEKHLHKNPAEDGPAGFMDFKKELIIALRDAAGLRWGGADLGKDNGDLMHFDGGTMSTAQKLRNKTKDVRAQRAAQASAEAAQ